MRSSVATISSPFLLGSHHRAEPLPSSGFHHLHRYYGLVRLLARAAGLGSRPWTIRCRTATSGEVSRVQRVSVATCRPCYPGGGNRSCRASRDSCCLRPPIRGSASSARLTRLRLGSLRATARRFAAIRLRRMASWSRFCWAPRGATQGASLRDCSTIHHGGLLSSR